MLGVRDGLFGLISNRTLHLAIIGLGHVGLPLALTFIEQAKVRVTGFDIDTAKTDALRRNEPYIKHLGTERLVEANATGLFRPTSDFSLLREADALLIAVPTPLTPQREPDMRYVVDTARVVRDNLRRGQIVILESTTYPGTTEELLKVILEESGLKCGQDFLLAYSPEREDPGNEQFCTASIPKIVGGVDKASSEVACALYRLAIKEVIEVESARVAEATKLTENIFRSVNIALVNELKVVFDRMGIDVWNVLDAAATKPFGFMRFSPGPGLGGHCIPLDPFYLAWKAREYGLSTRFVELAGEVNVSMPRYVISKLQAGLNDHGKPVKGSRVLVLGVSYKKDIDDTRESPALALIELLLELGAVVSYHDPHIEKLVPVRSRPNLPFLESVLLSEENLGSADVVLICTEHSNVDYVRVAERAQLIVDTRGIYREPRANVVKA